MDSDDVGLVISGKRTSDVAAVSPEDAVKRQHQCEYLGSPSHARAHASGGDEQPFVAVAFNIICSVRNRLRG